MKSLQEIAAQFGTHDRCIENWVNLLQITADDIEFAINHFTREQRREIMCLYIRPKAYLREFPSLVNHVQRIGVEVIKGLPESIYKQHLAQLELSDHIKNDINKRKFPYHEYDSEVFCAFRHATKKSDIVFIKKMFGRSIRHSSYPNAKRKLSIMARQYYDQ